MDRALRATSPGWNLCRPRPQGRETEQPANLARDQIRARRQPANGQGVGDRYSRHIARSRRRGDRMNNRRRFIALLASAAAASCASWPLAAHAQAPKKIPRMCILTFDPGTLQSNRFGAFFQGLRDLGYANGQSIAIDYLSAEGQSDRFPALAAECLRLKADLIVATTTPAAKAAKNATQTLPIVMVPLGDPVATGLVTSLARPGGNVTGLTFMASGLAAKRLALLKEAVPRLSRVLVLSYLVDPIAAPR